MDNTDRFLLHNSKIPKRGIRYIFETCFTILISTTRAISRICATRFKIGRPWFCELTLAFPIKFQMILLVFFSQDTDFKSLLNHRHLLLQGSFWLTQHNSNSLREYQCMIFVSLFKSGFQSYSLPVLSFLKAVWMFFDVGNNVIIFVFSVLYFPVVSMNLRILSNTLRLISRETGLSWGRKNTIAIILNSRYTRLNLRISSFTSKTSTFLVTDYAWRKLNF